MCVRACVRACVCLRVSVSVWPWRGAAANLPPQPHSPRAPPSHPHDRPFLKLAAPPSPRKPPHFPPHPRYSCTSGGCGTCEHILSVEGEEDRYVRMCIGIVVSMPGATPAVAHLLTPPAAASSQAKWTRSRWSLGTVMRSIPFATCDWCGRARRGGGAAPRGAKRAGGEKNHRRRKGRRSTATPPLPPGL